MVEYQNWYQVLRPIGSYINERSRVEILKSADESDLRLREKVRSMPFGVNKNRTEDAANREPFVPVTLSDKSLGDGNASGKSYDDIIMTRNLKKRVESDTYLSPKLKQFHDQEKEIKSIFWNLLKTVDLACPDDIDVDAIRDFLKKRNETLGRQEPEETDLDIFDKYGLGINARKLKGADEEYGDRRPRGAGVDSLMAMLDRMVEERTKPIPEGKDMYDKNKPITGKVGFRRDEINGPREYTDLDEELDFGDLDEDVDFKKFLVEKGRGRFDSEGNFIALETEADKRKRLGEDQKKGRKKKGRKGSEDDDSSDDESRRGRKGKSRKGRPRSASEMKAYLDDLKKARKYPDWDFPMCNYPKWVHRMYRMDQEKIGNLIKQGMDVPEYCPQWMRQVLDKVWNAKDASTRGEKPSNLRGGILKGRGSTSGLTAGQGKDAKKTGGDDDKKGKRKDRDGRQADGEALGMDGVDRRVELGGMGAGHSKTSFGLEDFLQGYEKEMLDLAKLENDSDFSGKHHPGDDSFDINDLIAEYETQLQREEDFLRGADERKKRQTEDKMRKMKERQEAAKKKIEDKNIKHLQDKQHELEKEELEGELNQEKQERQFNKSKSAFHPWGKSLGSANRLKKKPKKPKKITPVTQLCAEFKNWPRDPTMDEECMRRFTVLLQGRNKVMQEDEFMEIAKRIPLFTYEKAPPSKTPCERAKQHIC